MHQVGRKFVLKYVDDGRQNKTIMDHPEEGENNRLADRWIVTDTIVYTG